MERSKGEYAGNVRVFLCVSLSLLSLSLSFSSISLSHTHTHNQHRCPLCRAPFNRQDVIGVNKLIKAKKKQEKKKNKKRKREKMTVKGAPAAKVAALLQGLSEIKDDEQAVVFSQYTSFLNIVQET